MSGQKNIETTKLIAPATVSDSPLNLSDTGKEGNQSVSVSPVPGAADATSVAKATDQPSAVEQGGYYPPSTYEYYYPGYNGAFTDADGGSYTGNISDSNSPVYYYSGYGSYTTGYASTEYIQQQPCSYCSDAFPCYSYDSTYSANVSTGTAAGSGPVIPVMCPNDSAKPSEYINLNTNSSFSSNAVSLPFDSKALQQPSDISKPANQNQETKPLNKLASSFQATGSMKGYEPSSKYTFTSRQSGFYDQSSPATYQSNARPSSYNNNYQYRSREMPVRNSEPEAQHELIRGPRSNSSINTYTKQAATESVWSGLSFKRFSYNSKEFQIEYEDAKFYMIKSYSEDDVHKSIKYNVWSSTPNGNKKLDAAFHEAEAKTRETGGKKSCPIFLFFSVNASGQFVGVAEMIDRVDFSKDMDFWQLDKWNGFFPLKWHIVKDVPNTLFRHIILESNENKPVTYSRDTQEIGLKQGLEMLSIFKNYSEKTSLLDDFSFYENREKSLKKKRNAKSASHFDNSKYIGYKNHFEVGRAMARDQPAETGQSDPSSLISLTKNLSINP